MRVRLSANQGLALLAPALLVYCVFALYPMLNVVFLSFMEWNGLTATKQFVGLDNYVQVFTQDPVFWQAVRNTVLWTVLSVIFPPAMGFALALALNQNIPGRGPLRALFYLPVIIAPIAVATMWRWMYDPFFGLFNATLTMLGLEGLIQDWLGDRNVALYAMFVASVWQTVGFSLVLFLAGLQNVSETSSRLLASRREALEVFRFVTLPALRPSITIVLILSVINSLKAFDIVYGMTRGGPAQSTQMLALWAYTQAMQLGDFGRGAAISVVLLLITVAIVVPYMRWMRPRGSARVNGSPRLSAPPVSTASIRSWWCCGLRSSWSRCSGSRRSCSSCLRPQVQLDSDGLERILPADPPRIEQYSPARGGAAISARRSSTAPHYVRQGAARPAHFGDGRLRFEPYQASGLAGRSSSSSCSGRCCRSR